MKQQEFILAAAMLSLLDGTQAFISPLIHWAQQHPATTVSLPPFEGSYSHLHTKLHVQSLERDLQKKTESKTTSTKDTMLEGEKQESVTALMEDPVVLERTLEELTKPRPYPLFLAEKVAFLLESAAEDMFESLRMTGASSSEANEAESGEPLEKERVVVLGTGWGAASFLKNIRTDIYDVVVVSPRNHFVFTPMLAGASVGTVEPRSITQPIREINPKVKFFEATATNVDLKEQTVACQSVECVGNSCDIDEFTVPYDRLIVTVGAKTNTFGIPGVTEHCLFLRQIEDARKVRAALVNCFEQANLPNLSEEERRQNLSFVVVGAGPIGIEFAAELRDWIEDDSVRNGYYPHLLKYVSIKVVEASHSVLQPFDKSLQEEAIKRLLHSPDMKDAKLTEKLLPDKFKLTELLLDTSVKEVKKSSVVLNDDTEIPFGMAVWAAGNGPLPITLQLIKDLGKDQAKEQASARGRIAVDPWLRAIGGRGKIMVLGDSSCMTHQPLPATGQVAAQQAEYLASSLMNPQFSLSPPLAQNGEVFLPPLRNSNTSKPTIADSIAEWSTHTHEFAKPFQYWDLGMLAYTGKHTALVEVHTSPNGMSLKQKGLFGNLIWKSVYWNKQVSWRNRLLIVLDWIKQGWFGRDITRI